MVGPSVPTRRPAGTEAHPACTGQIDQRRPCGADRLARVDGGRTPCCFTWPTTTRDRRPDRGQHRLCSALVVLLLGVWWLSAGAVAESCRARADLRRLPPRRRCSSAPLRDRSAPGSRSSRRCSRAAMVPLAFGLIERIGGEQDRRLVLAGIAVLHDRGAVTVLTGRDTAMTLSSRLPCCCGRDRAPSRCSRAVRRRTDRSGRHGGVRRRGHGAPPPRVDRVRGRRRHARSSPSPPTRSPYLLPFAVLARRASRRRPVHGPAARPARHAGAAPARPRRRRDGGGAGARRRRHPRRRAPGADAARPPARRGRRHEGAEIAPDGRRTGCGRSAATCACRSSTTSASGRRSTGSSCGSSGWPAARSASSGPTARDRRPTWSWRSSGSPRRRSPTPSSTASRRSSSATASTDRARRCRSTTPGPGSPRTPACRPSGTGHFGLLNMQQRAEAIGAILDVRRWPTRRDARRSSNGGPADATPIRVAVVDDHPVVREGTAAAAARRSPGSRSSGRPARSTRPRARPDRRAAADVLLLDIRLGTESGLALLTDARRGRPAGGHRR